MMDGASSGLTFNVSAILRLHPTSGPWPQKAHAAHAADFHFIFKPPGSLRLFPGFS
jgi:hypothetical protein